MSPSTRRDTIGASWWWRLANSISPEISSGCSCIKPSIVFLHSQRGCRVNLLLRPMPAHGVNPRPPARGARRRRTMRIMNAPLDHPVVAEPHWRERGFMHSLGPGFWTELPAQPLPEVHWVARSDDLAAELGVADWLNTERALQVLSGNQPARQASALAS